MKASRSLTTGKVYPDVEARYWRWIFFHGFGGLALILAGWGGGPGRWVWVASVYRILWELSRFLLPGGHTWVVPILKGLSWPFSQAWVMSLPSLSSNALNFNLFLEANCMWSRTVRKKKKKKKQNLGPLACQLSPSPRARLSYIGRWDVCGSEVIPDKFPVLQEAPKWAVLQYGGCLFPVP